MRAGLIVAMFLFTMSAASAATISGIVYDLDLGPVDAAVVTISTQPIQRMVAADGTYRFTASSGTYTLEARATIDGDEWFTQENITIPAEGDFILDLILTPTFTDFEFDDEQLPELGTETSDESGRPYALVLALLALAFALALAFISRRAKKNVVDPAQEDEYVVAVLEAMRKHKGRITQKELRREVPFSEAKVSLVIAQLESEGKVQKIKKGRGNILVLK